jgi:DNA-binding NarL/FixJ family response regulator
MAVTLSGRVEGFARRTVGRVGATRILLADDDDRFRSLVRTVLEDDGYDVVAEAADAPSTVALAVEHAPDLVVTDLVLPGADGLSAVRQLRADRPEGAVLVLSSLFDPAVEAQLVALGASYLDKTEGLDALEAAIDAAVGTTAS